MRLFQGKTKINFLCVLYTQINIFLNLVNPDQNLDCNYSFRIFPSYRYADKAPSPPSEVAILAYISATYWSLWKKQFSDFFIEIWSIKMIRKLWKMATVPNYWVLLQFSLRLDQNEFQEILRIYIILIFVSAAINILDSSGRKTRRTPTPALASDRDTHTILNNIYTQWKWNEVSLKKYFCLIFFWTIFRQKIFLA